MLTTAEKNFIRDWQIQKEGPLAILLYELQTAIRNEIRRVLTRLHSEVGRNRKVASVVVKLMRIIGVRLELRVVSEELVESLLVRDAGCSGISQSPLAEKTGAIAASFEHLGNRDVFWLQRNLGISIAPYPGVAGMQASHQCAP